MSANTRPTPVPAPPQSPDAGVPWHFGDPHREQRRLLGGTAAVDLGHRDVLAVTGADRLAWLHSLTTAHLTDLAPGASSQALILSPHGHVEHDLHLADDGVTTWVSVEPGTGEAVRGFLDRMRFMLDVAVAARPDVAVIWTAASPAHPTLAVWEVPADFQGSGETPSGQPGAAGRYVPVRPAYLRGRELLVPRESAVQLLAGYDPAGTWALAALRVAAAVPRLGWETDHRTIPAEVGWIGPAVHLEKGCYRGQETVARVHNLGRPPRRLALAHLDGSTETLPSHGDPVHVAGSVVGWVGSAARHFELGPVATVIIKRNVAVDAELTIMVGSEPVQAGQQVVVTP